MTISSAQVENKAPFDCSPALEPKVAPWMRKLLRQPQAVFNFVETYGSPVHIVVDSEFRRNVKDLLAPIHSRGLEGGLFFARKANKLPFFVKAAKEEGIGVDTASLTELQETLNLGASPQNIVITAIGKDARLLSTAIANDCLIIIDNADELEMTQALCRSLGKNARIGLRFSGFEVATRKIYSRFGFPVEDAGALLQAIAEKPALQLQFLHAHIDRYDTEERACAARQLLGIVDQASSLKLQIAGLDLGGGILIRYLEKAEDFNKFHQELMASVAGERTAFTFQGDGLGYYGAGQEVLGKADLYPAWNNLSKERFISAILDSTDSGRPLYRELSDRKLALFFEPGRALLDNAGVTLGKVAFRKHDTSENLLIGLAMNRTHLRPFRAEFCSDPQIIAAGAREPLSEGAYIVGNLCSESDLIYRRKIKLESLPIAGDVFCFVNSAGYLAHHLEIGTHGDPLPANVLLDSDSLAVRDVFNS